ncbi:MAG: DUF1700 domain-containing protein [Oscillospiraceae bacterium]|nr:DUF1700 domain-containing protein [Lachnospiraceae bacterium]MBQ7871658.1 DUF1700 domain-containing protein [Oscillospiraceae bacterium]
MNKQEFLDAIRARLGALSPADAARSLDYYAEMIDDRVEDGLSEAEAVAEMESVEKIAAQILSEAAPQQSGSGQKLRSWELLLLILGSPIWLPLALTAAIVILAVWLVLWMAVVCCFAADLALGATALGGLFSGVVCAARGEGVQALFLLGGALVCAALAIVLYFGCISITKGVWRLSKWLCRRLRALLTGKENRQ